jgi:polysaccharide biosynthesis/export protein
MEKDWREREMRRMKVLQTILVLFVAICVQAAWSGASQAQQPTSQVAAALPAATANGLAGHDDPQNDPSRPALQQRYPRYKIQREDVLNLSFPLSPEFNQTVTVQPDGYISLYGGPNLHIQGMTVPEVSEAIKKAYTGTLHEPIVDIDLQDFQKPFFTVSGQVGKPGQYDLRHETTVSEAIGIAGGFTATAKTQVFLFRRVSSGWMEVKELKLNDILNGKKANEDVFLGPGDMIFVPEKFITKFRKYVPYYVGTGLSMPTL